MNKKRGTPMVSTLQCTGDTLLTLTEFGDVDSHAGPLQLTIIPHPVQKRTFTVHFRSPRLVTISHTPLLNDREVIKVEEEEEEEEQESESQLPPLVPVLASESIPNPQPKTLIQPKKKQKQKPKSSSIPPPTPKRKSKKRKRIPPLETEQETKSEESLESKELESNKSKFDPLSFIEAQMGLGHGPWTQDDFTDAKLRSYWQQFMATEHTIWDRKSMLAAFKKQVSHLNLPPLWISGRPNLSDWPLFHALWSEPEADEQLAAEILFSMPRSTIEIKTKVFIRCFASETGATPVEMQRLRYSATKRIRTEKERYLESWFREPWLLPMDPPTRVYRLSCTCAGTTCSSSACPFSIAMDYMSLCDEFPATSTDFLFRNWSKKKLLKTGLRVMDIQNICAPPPIS